MKHLKECGNVILDRGADKIKNKDLLTGTVPVNKELLTGTVPVNKELLTGRVPVNNLFHIFLGVGLKIIISFRQFSRHFRRFGTT